MDDINISQFYYDLPGKPKAFSEEVDEGTRKDKLKIEENEWQQEYHLIYNSYVLEYPGF